MVNNTFDSSLATIRQQLTIASNHLLANIAVLQCYAIRCFNFIRNIYLIPEVKYTEFKHDMQIAKC